MSKSHFDNTNIDNLIGNLRAEIGEIIQSWTIMREYLILTQQLSSGNFIIDIENNELSKVKLIKKKFENEIIAALSELGEKNYSRVNFYFATAKLNFLKNEASDFENFIKSNYIRSKRHEYISHKNLPPTWDEHKAEYHIKYATLLRAICKAIMLMKKIDIHYNGPETKYQWLHVRKNRYHYSNTIKADYLLLPFIRIMNIKDNNI